MSSFVPRLSYTVGKSLIKTPGSDLYTCSRPVGSNTDEL